MTGDSVPPGARCTRDDCEREAVNPTHPAGLCPEHHPTHENGESDENTEPEGGSPGSNPTLDAGKPPSTEPDTAELEQSANNGPTYAHLYLAARDRADGDRAYVPHEDLAAVFESHGWGDLVDQLRYLDEWLVWTPESRETPLYAYTPDLAGDTSPEREHLATLLEEAGVGTKRFIDVHNGQKGSFDTGNARNPDDPEIAGNYGVKGGRGSDGSGLWLVDIDIDDYAEAKESNNLVDDLREETLAVASAHTTTDRPGHLYVAVDGDPRAVVRDVLGRAVDNPQASFGEIRVDQQYVVGPGSEILCGCDRCTSDDTPESMGRYELANDRSPVVWTEEEFREFLLADPAIDEADDRAPTRRDDQDAGDLDGDTRDILMFAKTVDEYVESALQDARSPTDRSAADAALARAVAPWLEYDTTAIADVLDRHGTSKWDTRTDDSYRNSVLGYATGRAVDSYDTVPYWSLIEVAVDAGLVDREDLVERESDDGGTYQALPDAETYNATLAHIREEYDLDPGREPVHGYDTDTEPVAPLALKKLDALSIHERERFARKRGLSIPSTDDAREALRDAILREFRAGNTTVLDAPTALGKSYTVATEPWRRRASTTGESPVIHLHATTDARDEAVDQSREAGVDFAVLRGRKEASPLARGDHDPRNAAEDPDTQVVTIDGKPASKWFDEMCEGRNLPFSTALALARDRNDQGLDDLPPEGQEDPAVAQWDGLPRTEDGDPAKDVIHATHQFAYVPSLRRHTNVVLDEQPDFTLDLEQDRIRRMVNAYLREIDAPVTTWEAFVSLARFDHNGADSDAGREQDALDDALGTDPSTEWYVDDPDAHALAPDLTRAIWRALRWEEPNENDRRSTKVLHEPPRFDAEQGDQYAGTWLSVVIDEENTVRTIRSTPDFTQARAVIGLDAHPSMPVWELNAAPGMTRDAVLDPNKRRLWRRYERGLTVVQVGDATRPRSGPNAREWMNDERVRTVLERLRDHYGDDLRTAITTTQVEPAVREILEEFDDSVGEENTMHYGAEKSRNDFADEVAGLLYGCMDPGDEMILDALAELNLDAVPGTVETDDGEQKREKGRTFDGPDADTAEAVLASVRENHVAQAAGRYARNPDDPESRAVVFAMTDALPAGFADLETPGVEWLATETQREILDTVADRPGTTVREIADTVDCTKEHVRETLGKLEDENLVDRHTGAGDHGADVYHGDDLDAGLLDLGLESLETTNDALKGTSRWSLVICRPHGDQSDKQRGESPTSDAVEATTTGDPPPNTGD